MAGPFFLTKEEILDFHADQIRLFGGMAGLRDEGLLESSVAAPQHLYRYDEDADIFDLAAKYLSSLALNHPFFDGNKRTATQASLAFLRINGLTLEIEPEWLTATVYRFLEQPSDIIPLTNLLFLGCNPFPPLSEFLTLEPEFVSQYAKAKSDAERRALSADYGTAKLRVYFIQRCEKLMIQPNRFNPLLEALEEKLFDDIEAKLRRQFGMPDKH